jgi:hypothetical protein
MLRRRSSPEIKAKSVLGTGTRTPGEQKPPAHSGAGGPGRGQNISRAALASPGTGRKPTPPARTHRESTASHFSPLSISAPPPSPVTSSTLRNRILSYRYHTPPHSKQGMILYQILLPGTDLLPGSHARCSSPLLSISSSTRCYPHALDLIWFPFDHFPKRVQATTTRKY